MEGGVRWQGRGTVWPMAILFILLALLLVGAVADFLFENDVATAAPQPMTLAGLTFHLSPPVLAAIAFGMGVLAVLLIFAGIRRMRRTGRRTLQDRLARLEEENARLVTHRNLPNVIRIPDTEPTAAADPPASVDPPPPPTTSEPTGSSGGSTSQRW
jgi:membrane protein implicated in regulation of membrane protease activity